MYRLYLSICAFFHAVPLSWPEKRVFDLWNPKYIKSRTESHMKMGMGKLLLLSSGYNIGS